MSRELPPKRALNSIVSLPSLSALVASKPTFRTISLFFTYSLGTCTCSSTKTAMYGVKPLSVHQSCSARIRYGRVDVPAVAGAIGDVMLVPGRRRAAPSRPAPPLGAVNEVRRHWAHKLLAHHLLG